MAKFYKLTIVRKNGKFEETTLESELFHENINEAFIESFGLVLFEDESFCIIEYIESDSQLWENERVYFGGVKKYVQNN